VEGAL